MYSAYIKPILDLIISILVIIVLSPLLIVLIGILCFNNNGKPFFLQQRPGKKGYIFKLVKFKTMNNREDAEGILLPDNLRLTAIGKILRRTSLDELPQLFNVLKGDMSLIGPRPLLVSYIDKYSKEQSRRHEVKPGITGWAQVNGRNTISWEERFNYDVWYVDNISLRLDIKILWMTVLKVLRSEGINAGTNITMKPFTGTNKQINQ